MTWEIIPDLSVMPITYPHITDATINQARGVVFQCKQDKLNGCYPRMRSHNKYNLPIVAIEFRMIDLPLNLSNLPRPSEWFHVNLEMPYSIIPLLKWNKMGFMLSHQLAQNAGYLRPTAIEIYENGNEDIVDAWAVKTMARPSSIELGMDEKELTIFIVDDKRFDRCVLGLDFLASESFVYRSDYICIVKG
jgi:hypothetical protein